MDTFINRVDRMYGNTSRSSNISKQQLIQDIKEFQDSHIGYFPKCSHNIEFDSLLTEYDFLLTYLFKFYDDIIGYNNKGTSLELGKLFLVKTLIQDTVALRAILDMNLEIQFNIISRNALERMAVIYLCFTDSDYCDELFFNKSGFNEDERFYKLLRPSVLFKKMKSINTNMLSPISNGTFEDIYSLLSKFVHNDMYLWLTYFKEKTDRYNMSIHSNDSKYFIYRSGYMFQAILLEAAAVMMYYINVGNSREYASLLHDYFSSMIEDLYK